MKQNQKIDIIVQRSNIQLTCQLKNPYTAQKTEEVKATSVLSHQVVWDPKPWVIEDSLMKFRNLHEDGLEAGLGKKNQAAKSNFSIRNQRESNAHLNFIAYSGLGHMDSATVVV